MSSYEANLNKNYLSSSLPHSRILHLKNAQEDFEQNDISSSVLNQIRAVNCGTLNISFGVLKESVSDILLPIHNDINFINSGSCGDNELTKYAAKYLENAIDKLPVTSHSKNNTNYPLEDLENLKEFCQTLPEEWTIVHICKDFNPNASLSLESEIMSFDNSIFIAVLCHPRKDLSKEPVCVQLNTKNLSPKTDNIYQKFYNLSFEMKEKITFTGEENKKNKEQYWKGVAKLEHTVKNIINELKIMIGPWICLLCGKVDKTYKSFEKRIYDYIDQFCLNNCLDKNINILLSMIAINIKLLDEQDIENVSLYLSKESNCSKAIVTFLTEIKKSITLNFTYMPCILIIDELLDHFFWEMINPSQEYCRLESFHILRCLFEKYKDEIVNGYILLKVDNGRFIINPEKNLNDMEKRMKSFYEYWLPHWNGVIGETPSSDTIQSFLQTQDVYSYSGHGSGLQYCNGYKISKFNSKSVIFLFGCDSVRLQSTGLHSLRTGSHLYFHNTLCPAVIGNLIIVLDFQIDQLSTFVLSNWIPSKEKVHWSYIDKNKWRKGEIIKINGNNSEEPYKYESRLAYLLSKIRTNADERIFNRICLVYRGLPVINVNACE